MTQCGRCPRPVAELEPADHNTSRIGNFGYGGPQASVGRHQISRKRPAVEFPASLPPPLKTEKLTASPAIGVSGGRPEPASADVHATKSSDGGGTQPTQACPLAGAAGASKIADTPEHASADLLRQQVAALQAQLAEQAKMLNASQQTIRALEERQADGEDADQLRASLQQRDQVIQRLNEQVQRLAQQPVEPATCPPWATPCRHGRDCANRADPSHAMALWHPP